MSGKRGSEKVGQSAGRSNGREQPDPRIGPPPGPGGGQGGGRPGGPSRSPGGNKTVGGPFGGVRGMVWMVIAMLLTFWLLNALRSTGGEDTISYTRFRELVDADRVVSVTLRGPAVRAQLADSARVVTTSGDTAVLRHLTTYVPESASPDLLEALRARDVEVQAIPENEGSGWWLILTGVLPFVLLGGLMILGIRRFASRGRGLLSIGQSRAKRYERRKERTTFRDVAGCEGAKEELSEIIDYLRDPTRFRRIGARVPKGVLLMGPPGTGKTLLARAVAGEANVPFFSITGSDFMEMFVGVGASRVRSLFEQAKGTAPAIVFIDELDSIGRRRGTGLGGGHDEREQTLNQLLSELDGFEPTESVIVIAATNRPDILDPALLRPGRFDRRIAVELPTASEREEILRIHARNKPLDEEVDLRRVADSTPGLSGAELDNLLNEAALLAGRRRSDVVTQADVEDARDKILMGLRRHGLVLGDDEMRILAHHEAGHAIVAALLPDADPLHKVTIVPRGRAMGVTQQLPERDRYIYERRYMIDRITVMMGGRAAEDLVFDTITSGAENDLEQATALARRMVTAWGMSDRVGPMATGESQEDSVFLGRQLARGRPYSESTARMVDEEVRAILDDCFERARSLLENNRESLDRAAGLLLAREELTGAEIMGLLDLDSRANGNRPRRRSDARDNDATTTGTDRTARDRSPDRRHVAWRARNGVRVDDTDPES